MRHGPSFLRWAGSKRKALPALVSLYQKPDRYVEPFAGSAALFFAIKPQRALISDLNRQLINLMVEVRERPSELHRRLVEFPRDAETYYRIRNEFNDMNHAGLESAVRFLYLNRNCFNGLWRTNLKGHYNVPWGGDAMGENPPIQLIASAAQALKRADLRAQDFRETIANCGEGDFIYADPPYFTSGKRTFVEYGKESFGEADLGDLIELLTQAADRGAKVALSYCADMPLKQLPKHWSREELEVVRNVAGFKGKRRKEKEVLYSVGIQGERVK